MAVGFRGSSSVFVEGDGFVDDFRGIAVVV